MITIKTNRDMQKVPFGTQVDFGHAHPAYYSNKGTDNGEKWGMDVYFTLRRDGCSILEEETIISEKQPKLIGTTVHDNGTSGDYQRLDAYLRALESKAA